LLDSTVGVLDPTTSGVALDLPTGLPSIQTNLAVDDEIRQKHLPFVAIL
jgi:hypothetical protein